MFARFFGALGMTGFLGGLIYSIVWSLHSQGVDPLWALGCLTTVYLGWLYINHLYEHIKYGHDKK